MKLHELFEAYDSEIELQWSPIANGEAAGFKINETPYVIQIFQSKKIGDVRTNEVSFYRPILAQAMNLSALSRKRPLQRPCMVSF